jgi:class 3 adenylate cyclase
MDRAIDRKASLAIPPEYTGAVQPPRTLLAVALIYDIRGFSTAARRIPEEVFGSFITATHELIVPILPKASFVKNLGDGNLLLWELSEPPTADWLEALARACLTAQREYGALVARQNFDGVEHLPRDLGFGIAFGPVMHGDDYYGNAVNLAARLQDCARPRGVILDEAISEILGRRVSSLGQPVRLERAKLKGVGRVHFHWIARLSPGERWSRTAKRMLRWAAPVAFPVLLYAWVDGGLPFPIDGKGGIDALDASVLRPHPTVQAADGRAQRLRASLLSSFGGPGIFDAGSGRIFPGPGMGRDFNAWTDGRVLTALLMGTVSSQTAVLARHDFDALFEGQRTRDGKRIEEFIEGQGFIRHPVEPYPHGDTTAWVLLGLIEARGNAAMPHDAIEDDRISRVWDGLKGFFDPACRGWHWRRDQSAVNALGDPDPENEHYVSTYTTTLAAWVLIEARRAGIELAAGEELLKATLVWLCRHYIPGARGWGAAYSPKDLSFAPDEVIEDYADGLTFQTYATLLAAERWAADTLPDHAIPSGILMGMQARLRDVERRGLLFPVSKQRWIVNIDEHGHPHRVRDIMDFFWIPWANAALRLHMALHARSTRERVEVLRSIDKVLGLSEKVEYAGINEPAEEIIGLSFYERGSRSREGD